MCASQRASTKPAGRNESKTCILGVISRLLSVVSGRQRTADPSRVPLHVWTEAELERTRWYPKDGELCLSRLKPEETLVEDRSDSDVQIDRRTWV